VENEVDMVKHVQCKGVGDVDKFLNKAGLKPGEVNIVHVAGGYGSYYMVFFDEPADLPHPET
jgi:hypothetical protein